ncbi:MAG: rRNA pseudouridine synthase [Candidatus Thermoplasmatota archaeon]|nr:rRNA pseudouridine synthase [Candidatus Thermoplasmatota archaeon]
MEPVRLQRYLARCGLGSRRACERMITEGRVSVNGTVVWEQGARVGEFDVVMVDGRAVAPEKLRYFIINKPPGTISVDQDLRGRRYIVDLIPGGREMGLFPVGRLDLDTSGLMILTNDGDLGNRIAHPRYGISKEYVALVKGRWSIGSLKEASRDGVKLDDGSLVRDIVFLQAEPRGDRTVVTLRIHEGRKHVVKRIFLSLGSRVIELHRSAIGELGPGGLREGEWREVRKKDILERMKT